MQWEEFESKIERWEKMNTNWYTRWGAAPPLYRWMWKKKIMVRPPLLEKPLKLTLFMSVYWLIFMILMQGAILTMRSGSVSGESIAIAIISSLVASLLFGVTVTLLTAIERKFRKLPKWEDI